MHGDIGERMKEYNELTKRLLSEGYTVDNYPNYIQLPGGVFGKNPLENIYGGFEYKPWYRNELVYKTGCGKFVYGKNVIHDMGYMGIDWTHENGNPVIRCPYDKANCEFNNPLLHGTMGGGLCIQCWCECHRSDEPYNIDNSFEKAEKDRQEEKDRKYNDYSNNHNGRVCGNHMYYDERTRTWKHQYSPNICANRCFSTFCPVLGKELDKKKGNVYYDLKTSGIRHDGTLFDGEVWVHIEKGIRFFDHSVSMDICNSFVKLQPERIFEKYKWNKLTTMQIMDKTYKAEIFNIRSESKPSRDLLQDLEDIKAGITITHSSDVEKKKKENKKAKRQEAQEKRIEKLEKKILQVGYENMEDYSLDKVHADKWITKERILEIETERARKIREEKTKPIQMNLNDFLVS